MDHCFVDLVDERTLAELLESLRQVTGMASLVADRAGKVVASAGAKPCYGVNRPGDPCVPAACGREASRVSVPSATSGGYSLFKCPMGFCAAAVPIMVGAEEVAVLHLGQFLPSQADRDSLASRAAELGIRNKQCLEMAGCAPVVEPDRLEPVIDLYSRLVRILAEQGRERLRLAAAWEAPDRDESLHHRLIPEATYIYTLRVDKGRIVFATHGPGCEVVTGYPPRAFEQDSMLWAKLVHDKDREQVISFFESMLARATVAPLEHRIRRKDGAVRWIRNTPVTVRGPGRKATLFEGLVRDITDWKLKEEALVEARLAAERASRAKSEFLASMSHEIRTPLNAILGLTKLALKRADNPDIQEFLEGIAEAGEALLGIVGGVLDFSKIEAGRLELEDGEFNPLEVLYQAARTLEAQAARKGLSITVEADSAVPRLIRGDAGRFRQVLVNLIGNAVKFTSGGGITVSVAPEPEKGEQPLLLRVSVRDTGIGIPPSRLEAIFDPFTQADSATPRRFGGTGLGLAICRKLVAMMGGRIWAESEEGRGSTFQFTIALNPLEGRSPTAEPEPVRRPLSSLAGKRLRILLAEDDATNQVFAKTFLEEEGHTVTLAENGERAVELLGRAPFDLVLMDVSMPVMDGLEATRLIRAGKIKGVDPNLPIVAITAHAFKGDRERFLKAGMDGCVIKPVDLEELLAVLRDIQGGKDQAPRTWPPIPEEFDAAWLRKWFEGRERVLASLLTIFKDETPGRIRKLHQALEEAAGCGSHEAALVAGSEARNLKGCAAVVGAVGVRSLAARLEEAVGAGELDLAFERLDGLEGQWRATHEALEAGGLAWLSGI